MGYLASTFLSCSPYCGLALMAFAQPIPSRARRTPLLVAASKLDNLDARLRLALRLFLIVGFPELVPRLVGLRLALEVVALRASSANLYLSRFHDQRHSAL